MTWDLEDSKARKEVRVAALRAEAAQHNAETVAAWRSVDPANRTCSDRVALLLAGLAATFGREK